MSETQGGTGRKRTVEVGFTVLKLFSSYCYFIISLFNRDVYTIYFVILWDEKDISSSKRSRHACETCGKVFTRPDNLKQHQKIHYDEKPHPCDKCDKYIHRNSHLKRHVKQVHERRAAQREYQCSTCGQTFHNLAPFRAHQKTARSKPLSTVRKRPRQEEDSFAMT